MELRDTGGDGPPVLFLHGALVDGSLWDPVIDLLGGRRCLVPTLPLGSHTSPVADRSLLTPLGVTQMIAELLDSLDVSEVTVVGNDTGGGLMQLLVTSRPERISKLVFTNCDALEVFPPWMFKPMFWLGRSPLALEAVVAPMRIPAARRLPIAFGWLTKRASDETLARWVHPALSDREILRDVAHFIAHTDRALVARRRATAVALRRRGGVRLGRRRPLFPGRAGPPTRGPVPRRALRRDPRFLRVRADRPPGRAGAADLIPLDLVGLGPGGVLAERSRQLMGRRTPSAAAGG